MSSRRAILDKITRTLGDDGHGQRLQAARDRIAAHRRHLIPARTQGKSPDDLVALLRAFLEGQRATVLDLDGLDAVPAAIAGHLRAHNLPARLRTGDDPVLAGLPWQAEPALQVVTGRAALDDVVGLSRAVAGVAETGTLVLTSGANNPVTVTFLPDAHLVLLSRRDVVGCYEDVWDRLRASPAGHALPRTVNMVSGPSRTADIASQIVNGAHGPKHLCVLLVP